MRPHTHPTLRRVPRPPSATLSLRDLDEIEAFGQRWFEPLSRYHRLEVRGIDHIPAGPCVLVANHSGGMYIGDGLWLLHFHKTRGYEEAICPLAHAYFFNFEAGRRNLLPLGIFPADQAWARATLDDGGKVLVFPGADFDAMRTFAERKEVHLGGRHGFLRLALSAGVPIVPVVNAGGHETFCVLSSGRKIADALGLRRHLRVHSFPATLCVPWGLTVGFGSYVPYLPLPSRITVQIGRPIDVCALARDRGLDPSSGHAREELEAVYDHVSDTMQGMLDGLYAERSWPVLG